MDVVVENKTVMEALSADEGGSSSSSENISSELQAETRYNNSTEFTPSGIEDSDSDMKNNNFLSHTMASEEFMDIRRRYTCFYCGFSVEKFKYIRSHIKRFHIVDPVSYTEKCPTQVNLEKDNCGSSSPTEVPSKMETDSPEVAPVIKEEMSISPPVPPPPPAPSQSKPFNMDLCPYCDFSDKNEKKLRHHILSRHSKELDKIILYESDIRERDGKSNKQNDTSSFRKSSKASKSVAQLEKDQNVMSDEGSSLSHTSDKNQNNILPFTQSLVTGNESLNYLQNNSINAKEENNFKCPLCDFQTFQSWDFLLHNMQHHPSSNQSQFSDSNYNSLHGNFEEPNINAYEITHEKLYSCIHCHYTTPRMQLLNRHLLSKHSDRRPHKCDHCDYATKRLEHLNRHILSKHSGQKPFQCEFCDYRAARDDHLRNHILSKHSEETLLRCTHCNYSAVNIEQLNIHLATKHSDLKTNFTCQLCSYSTLKEEHLTRHMAARHSNLSLYNCDQCEFNCSNPETLNQHMLTHTMKLPYQCKFCDFGSSKLEDLNAHLISKHKNGRPHVCPECDYRATRLGHLTRHIQTRHSGVKPFPCPQCPYQAGRVEHLHRHLFNKHSDYKPFSCQSCDYSTFREDLLNNHYLIKHIDQGFISSDFCDIAIKLEEDNELPEKLPNEGEGETESCPEPNIL